MLNYQNFLAIVLLKIVFEVEKLLINNSRDTLKEIIGELDK